MKTNRIQTYAEFWPFYLQEHRNGVNRFFHFIGTSFGLVCVVSAILRHDARLAIAAFASGYFFAWIGHFCVEKNRPATFRYPIWSFISDFRMWFRMLTFRSLK